MKLEKGSPELGIKAEPNDGELFLSRMGEPSLIEAEYRVAAMSKVGSRGLSHKLGHHRKLIKKSDSEQQSQPINFTCTTYFPWNEHTISRSSSHKEYTDEDIRRWRVTVSQWTNVVAVCGGSDNQGQIILFHTGHNAPLELRGRKIFHEGPRRRRNHGDGSTAQTSAKLNTLVWALDPQTLHPLVITAGDEAVIRIWDVVSRSTVGRLRGHGGPIHSLVIHPTNPFIFASTSRDMSIRIYTLLLPASSTLVEETWPTTSTTPKPKNISRSRSKGQKASSPSTGPAPSSVSMGTPHGGSVYDGEGFGIGKCFVVLRGYSTFGGGHKASVLNASFHRTRNFIATCGVDNSVKIWRLPPLASLPTKLTIEDKPVFNASTVHESRINSIHWLTEDILASRSCGAEGTLVIWKWTEINRFTPWYRNTTIRAKETDFKESRAFITLARTTPPVETLDACKLGVHLSTSSTSANIAPFDPIDSTILFIPVSPKEVIFWHANRIPQAPAPPAPTSAMPSSTKTFRSHSTDSDSSSSSNTETEGSADDSEGTNLGIGIKRLRLSRLPKSVHLGDQTIEMGNVEPEAIAYDEWIANVSLDVAMGFDQITPKEDREEWFEGLEDGDLGIECVSVSPFDATWVVAAGRGEMLVIWKRILSPFAS
ncbi:hypothetical protein FRB93_002924 [Tulasnella sp. JGI-2019a]|nr:hypothetical protein FRB93_002924 [Tulasnella sp. JGI-2019a]